jgi:hypothetical protein
MLTTRDDSFQEIMNTILLAFSLFPKNIDNCSLESLLSPF